MGLVQQASPRKKRSHFQPAAGPEKAFGQALRELRTRKGTSQEQLALSAGFDRTYVSLIERGISSPTIRTICRLSEILEIKPSLVARRMEAILAGGTGRGTPAETPSGGAENTPAKRMKP